VSTSGTDQSQENLINCKQLPKKGMSPQLKKYAYPTKNICGKDQYPITHTAMIGSYKKNDDLIYELHQFSENITQNKGYYIDICQVGEYSIYVTKNHLTLAKNGKIIVNHDNLKNKFIKLVVWGNYLWALNKFGKLFILQNYVLDDKLIWNDEHKFTKKYEYISVSYDEEFLYLQEIKNFTSNKYKYRYYIYNKAEKLIREGESNKFLIFGKDINHYLILDKNTHICDVYIQNKLSYTIEQVHIALLDYYNEVIVINQEYAAKYHDIRYISWKPYYLLK
jgi:hypothetical protein